MKALSSELKGDRPQFIHPDLFIHPGRVHVGPIGPGHGAEIQASLIKTGFVLERFEDAAFGGRQNRREIRDALRVIHEGDGETVIGINRGQTTFSAQLFTSLVLIAQDRKRRR